MNRAAVTRALLFTALVMAARPGFATPTCIVCIAEAESHAPAAIAALEGALRLESRKAGVPVAIAHERDACRAPDPDTPTVTLSLAGDEAVLEVAGEASSERLSLAAAPAGERVSEIARAVVAALRRGALARHAEPLLEPGVPVVVPASVDPIPPRPFDWGVGGLLLVGGGYTYGVGAAEHRAIVDGDVALTLFHGALALGVAGGFSPSHAVAGGEPAVASSQGELLGVLRGGLRVGPARLRLGVGGGWQWRRVEIRSDFRFDDLTRESGAAALALELDALIPLSDYLVLAVSAPGRIWFGGDTFTWNGRTVYDAPRGAVGLSVRLGVAL